MNSRLLKMARSANGRFLQQDERDALLAFAQSLPLRFQVADEIEAGEEAILRAVVQELQTRYPNFDTCHDQGWARCYRDLQFVLRHDVQAMIFENLRSLEDRTLLWMQTMFAAMDYTPKFCHDCFALLREHVQALLRPEHFELIRPSLEQNIEVLGSFPEPLAPAV